MNAIPAPQPPRKPAPPYLTWLAYASGVSAALFTVAVLLNAALVPPGPVRPNAKLPQPGPQAVAAENKQEPAVPAGTAAAAEPVAKNSPQGTPASDSASTSQAAAQPAPPAASASAAPAAPVAAPPPASAPSAAAAAGPPFAEVCFQDFDYATSIPDEKGIEALLARLPGQKYSLSKHDTRKGKGVQFEGTARLNQKLTPGSSLRLSLENYDRLRLHFVRGERGVTLVYHENQNYVWAAYRSLRKGGSFQFEPLELKAADWGIWRRTEMRYGGPFELRHEQGELVLSRGDIIVLRAPLPEPEVEIYVEGKAIVLGCQQVASRDFPAAEPPLAAAHEVTQPATSEWKVEPAEGVSLERMAGGAVALVAQKQPRAYASTALPNVGPAELIVQLQNVSPGSGIYLGGAVPRGNVMFRFLTHKRYNRLAFQPRGEDDQADDDPGEWLERPLALCGDSPWLKLVYGAGLARVWLSTDGQHWAEYTQGPIYWNGNTQVLGLYCPSGTKERRLTLVGWQLRPLAALQSLVPEPLFRQAPEVLEGANPGDWLVRVNAAQPAGANAEAWRRACALKALGRGLPPHLGQAAAEALALAPEVTSLPPAKSLAALREAALVFDLHDGNRLMRVLGAYGAVGEEAFRAGDLRPWSLVRPALLAAPLLTPHHMRTGIDSLVRHELLALSYADRPDDLLDTCRLLRFYQQHHDQRWVEWAESQAGLAAVQPRRRRGEKTSRKATWLPLAVDEIDRESYNALAEIDSTLENGDPRDACAAIAQFDPLHNAGLTVDTRDSQLLLAPDTALAALFERHPALRENMRQHFAQIAALRYERAKAESNEQGALLVTLQFPGTEAARSALTWLGDRRLTAGRFREALAFYQQAQAGEAASGEGLARQRLAAAYLGQEIGPPSTGQVQLGQQSLAAAEFEGLVTQARQRAAGQAAVATAAPLSRPNVPPDLPKMAGYAAHPRSRLEGELGEHWQEVPGHLSAWGIPWADWQLGFTTDENALYLGNRFQVAAYDLASGQFKWRTASPGASTKDNGKARTHEWSLVPMRPVVAGKFVYCRMLNLRGAELVCLARENGSLAWRFQGENGEQVISDPVVFLGEVWVLVLGAAQQGECSLRLRALNGETGELVTEFEWPRVREIWHARRHCGVALHGSQLIATLGGLTVGGDLVSGRVHWARFSPTLSPEVDGDSRAQRHELPLVVNNTVVLVQPGVRGVERCDLASGRLLWRRLLPEARGLLGGNASQVFVFTERHLLALATETGATLWTRPLENPLSGFLLGENRLLIAQAEPLSPEGKEKRVRLVWLEAGTGSEQGSGIVEMPPSEWPALQFVAVRGEKTWALAGQRQEPDRNLVELVASGAALPGISPVAASAWLAHVPAVFPAGMAQVLPGWQLLAAEAGPGAGYRREVQGEANVLTAHVSPGTPLELARWVEFPQGSKPVLRAKVFAVAGAKGQIETSLGSSSLPPYSFDGGFGGKWQEVAIPLDPAAVRQGWLQFRFNYEPGGQREIHLRMLRVEQ